MQEHIIRWPQVRATTGLSRTTAWRLEKVGQFPRRRSLGPNSVGWLQSEITQWVETRAVVGGALNVDSK